MKSMKPNRKSTKIKRSFKPGVNKNLKQRVRTYALLEDENKRWEERNMSQNLISSTAVSRINAIATDKSDIINKQKEASLAIQQLTAEYNSLKREHDKRDKLLKEDLKIRDKLATLQEQRREQERKLIKYTKRKKDLEALESSVRDNEEYFQDLQFEEQLNKDKESHQNRILALQRQQNLSRERAEQHHQRTLTLQDIEQERQREADAKIELIRQKETYERHKKLREENEKLELLRRETELIKYNPDQTEIDLFKADIKNIEDQRVALEHEKMRSSMIRGANDKLLHDLLETRTNAARSLTGDQLNEIQRDIESQTQNIQELYYQNTKNELLQKTYKNTMEISHIKAANTSLENNILAQVNNITAHINHLESQLQASEQRNTQITSESNEHRIKTFEHQANLELKIAQLEQEKANLIAMVQQLQGQI